MDSLSKMKVDLIYEQCSTFANTSQASVLYSLILEKGSCLLNEYLGKKIAIEFEQQINCIYCKRATKKSFNQGYCFPCFRSLARCDSCIVSPEKCHYHLGTCREPTWGEQHCMQDHVVYLANSSGLKIGITRATQIPTRWIDQGAIQALPIAKVHSRYQAGLLEIICKQYVKDKTNWREMLKSQVEKIDLFQARDSLYSKIKDQIDPNIICWDQDSRAIDISYPAIAGWALQKIVSLDLEKAPVTGILKGIKGQYLILDTGVINIRKFAGYKVSVSLMD